MKYKTYRKKPTKYWQKKTNEFKQLFILTIILLVPVIFILETAILSDFEEERCIDTKTELERHHELPVASDKPLEVEIIELVTHNPEVETMIYNIADEMGRPEYAEYLVKLAFCESSMNPNATNDKGNNPSYSVDRGLFQYNSYWQSHITDECAYSVECATKNTIKMIEAGKQHRWVCDSKVKGVPIHLVINK